MTFLRISPLLLIVALAGCSSPDQQLRQALEDGNSAIVKQCIEHGAELYKPVNDPPQDMRDFLPPLSHAAYTGQADHMKLLVNAGADPNKADSYGWYPLHYAAFKRQPHIVAYLLKIGADPNVTVPDTRQVRCSPIITERFSAGATPLMLAVFAESARNVELLLNHKAKIDLSDNQNHTALWQVSEKIRLRNSRRDSKLEKIRRLLLKAGADPQSAQ